MSFESQAGLHLDGSLCQAEDPENSTMEPGQSCQPECASLRFAFLPRFPQQQLGALLQLSLLLCLLGPPSRDPVLWGPRCTRSQCERAAVTTSGPSMRAAFGAEEKLRAGREMKPIMGFLSICFILALNACPPLTLWMEFYCVQVRRHCRQEACVWEQERGCSEPPFFSLLGFGATRLPGTALRSIFRAVVSGRRKDLPFKHRASSVGRRTPLTLCLDPFLNLNARTEPFLGSETHTIMLINSPALLGKEQKYSPWLSCHKCRLGRMLSSDHSYPFPSHCGQRQCHLPERKQP